MRLGYDLEQLRSLRQRCRVPLITSGGAGEARYFLQVLLKAGVDGALAVTVFHLGEIEISAKPTGPACHTGAIGFFANTGSALLGTTDQVSPAEPALRFLAELEGIIADRLNSPVEESYTARLVADGRSRIAQKVGEEGLEVALAAATGARDSLLNESADLLFHLLVLLGSEGLALADVVGVLECRQHT